MGIWDLACGPLGTPDPEDAAQYDPAGCDAKLNGIAATITGLVPDVPVVREMATDRREVALQPITPGELLRAGETGGGQIGIDPSERVRFSWRLDAF